MKKELRSIMLVDDNPADNFYHQRIIKKYNSEIKILTFESAKAALEFIKTIEDLDFLPNLIFLDINMPGMNGWEFLEEYELLDKVRQSKLLVIMLTTSENPSDIIKARTWNFVADFKSKPLSQIMLEEIEKNHFNN